jgi:two-component system OmpR family response regulator
MSQVILQHGGSLGIKKVLLVDDEPDIRTIGQMSLQMVGKWEVMMAVSGVDALLLLKTEKPDLILLDVMMPALDGPATLAKLKQNPETADIPVIFMTAKVQRQEIEQYLKLGVCGVISKPFDPLQLPQEILKIIAGK